MTAALARNDATGIPMPPDLHDVPPEEIIARVTEPETEAPNPLMEEVRLGFEELRGMSHAELRTVIDERVAMLEGILRQRAERRAAIETAQLASKMLELRRERSVRIRRRVDLGSALAAVASTVVIVAVMI